MGAGVVTSIAEVVALLFTASPISPWGGQPIPRERSQGLF